MLRKLGRAAAKHHWWFIGGWFVLLIAVWAVAIGLGGQPNNNFVLPGSQSQDALDLLDKDFPAAANTSATIVYHSSSDVATDSDITDAITKSLAAVGALDDVSSVQSPLTTSSLVSSDAKTALANVLYSKQLTDLADNGEPTFDDLQAAIDPFRSENLDIQLGGSLPGSQQSVPSASIVLVGLFAALIILLIVLGTWWSFAWPVVGSLAGVGVGVGLVHILEYFIDIPTISDTAAIMIGLGVGIDYALFIMARTKDHMGEGDDPVEASGRAMSTMGRAVLTAGATVIVALGALLVFDVPAVTAMAYTVVLVVVAVMGSATTLMPAIIGAVGPRLATSRVPWRRATTSQRSDEPTGMRWAAFVTRFAPISLALGVIVLLVLAIPVFRGDLRLGPIDNSLFPTDSTQYKAWKLQSEAFGAGSTNPFLVVVQIPSGENVADLDPQLATFSADLTNTKDVASVTGPLLDSDRTLAVFQLTPKTGAQNAATADLVPRLRDETIPKATKGTNLTGTVTGSNAIFVDLDDRILDRLFVFIAIVMVVAFVILGAVFRSILIPLKAVLFNLLTVLATYGVIVAFLTYGWGRSWIGIPANLPVLSLLAPVIFAMLFGLSNDYEVYLISRMREERDDGASPSDAVRRGQGHGSPIVIAAALVMVFVFASYMAQPGASVKQFGFGMAAAILIDAFITRMVMLPAAMYIGGAKMWWPGSRRSASSMKSAATSP